ncbi:hypothetical protein [Pseudomonas sp. TWP3-2]|uniref:hypothetical protein n=1 Tax=Pseudomonas sp. TWP3-2 TaxID=2804574 RepID=UPI003CF20644
MSFDQFVGLSGILLFTLFILNYGFSAYVATRKLEEIQSHLSESRLVAAHRGDKSTPVIFKVGNLEVVYALLVLKFVRNMDPGSIGQINNFPKKLRPWVIIPGHINTFCLLWFLAIFIWINIKDYL